MAGRVILRRREDKALDRENVRCEVEIIPSPEALRKSQPPQAQGQTTTGEEATVESEAGKRYQNLRCCRMS